MLFSDEAKAGGGSFVKLDDGEKIVGVFRSPSLAFKSNFRLKTEYKMGLPLYPEGTVTRVKINFLVNEKGTWVPKVFAGTSKTAAAIDGVVAKFGLDYAYEIQRDGKDKPVYRVLPERALTPEEIAIINEVKLLDLTIKSGE
jgi:hypothetical protein